MKQRRNRDSLGGSSSSKKSSQQPPPQETQTTSTSASSSLSIVDAGGADDPPPSTSVPRRRRTKTMTQSSTNFLHKLVRRIPEIMLTRSSSSSTLDNTASTPTEIDDDDDHKDRFNYALLIVLYTLQGIPMGLSASIPFLLQDKIQKLSSLSNVATDAAVAHAQANKLSYQANAVFALCSWPFSLKLLWAPIVDAVFWKQFGRRKTWLIPVQTLAGSIMVFGANFVERQLGLTSTSTATTMNVKGVTAFFFVLYFLMATQDIAVDGWALTMLRKANRGKGPVCNSIGQNIGYFLSFVGFLALNDAESSESIWRPLLRLPSKPGQGLVSLQTFLKSMGYFMLATTTVVALFKREVVDNSKEQQKDGPAAVIAKLNPLENDHDDDDELDAAEIGLKETYKRLWAVCQLPAVRWLFVVLVTYRLPTALSDNVKFLKAVELGMSKSTTALLSPTLILPLGILVPIFAAKVWKGHPLTQFSTAYKFRVTLVPVLDLWLLHMVRSSSSGARTKWFWVSLIASTAAQAICNTLQFNAQMMFFASRVDPAIGGSYMTLLNTAANLGGTWPASFSLWLIGKLTDQDGSRDPYMFLQTIFSGLGIAWIFLLGKTVKKLGRLPEDAWKTHLLDNDNDAAASKSKDLESGVLDLKKWTSFNNGKSGQKQL